MPAVTTAADEGSHTNPARLAGPGEAEVIECLDTGALREALALCARHHGLCLGRLCMALLANQAEAEDVVQDTLLAAYASFASWRRESSVRAWLLGIARNKALKQLEQRRTRGAKLHLIKGGEPLAPHAEDYLLLQQKAVRARRALEQIRPTEREALLLRYVGELEFSGVAAACGASEATARKRVSRGIARLREVLSESEEP